LKAVGFALTLSAFLSELHSHSLASALAQLRNWEITVARTFSVSFFVGLLDSGLTLLSPLLPGKVVCCEISHTVSCLCWRVSRTQKAAAPVTSASGKKQCLGQGVNLLDREYIEIEKE